MASFFDLNLNTISIDAELAKQVPYALSSYYLALPLARENGRVSVIMAHPENAAALQTLGRLLDAHIVLVAGSATAIQTALAHIYHPDAAATPVLAWSDADEWHTAVHRQ